MSQSDEQLSRLLKSWRAIEPRGSFEANVRRRIRQAASESTRPVWFWQPAFAMAAAVVIAVGIGAWSGAHSVGHKEATGFLAQDTLTARYLGVAR
jgi:hypothetical protein